MGQEPRLSEELTYEGRRYLIEWFDPPFVPPWTETTQAYGICFTDDGSIVLVENAPGMWQLPGGGIEAGESFEQALAREVIEEACARVLESEYIGCQRVTPLDGGSSLDGRGAGRAFYHQTRHWARVELDAWDPHHETTARTLVTPEGFRSTLWWGAAPHAAVILEHGLRIERAR